MENRHQPYDLKQMQSLPLEYKIAMTKQRIEAWYDAWKRVEIINENTGNVRYQTIDCRDVFAMVAVCLVYGSSSVLADVLRTLLPLWLENRSFCEKCLLF